MARRVWIGGIWHETNTFVRGATSRADFIANAHHAGDELLQALSGTRTEVGGVLAAAARHELAICPGLWTAATPSGLVAGDAYAGLKAELLDSLRRQRPVEAAILALHGAMVAAGEDDPEGDLIEAVRALLGPDVPIVVTLDLHANVSERMARAADALIPYDTYPHVDAYERGEEACGLVARILDDGIIPGLVLVKPPLLACVPSMNTASGPMQELMAKAHAAEANEPGLTHVGLAPGYPYADVPAAGLSVIVGFTEGPERATTVARELASAAWSSRLRLLPQGLLPPDAAIARIQSFGEGPGPVALIDVGDNIGGGSPGDGTVLLAALVAQGVQGALVALADPEAVAAAVAAGAGGVFDGLVGGKHDDRHGAPVRLRGRVQRLTDGEFRYSGSYMTGRRVQMGRTAVVVDAERELTVLLTERKVMPFDQGQFRSAGIDPLAARVLVLKSAIAWRAAYEADVRGAVEVDTPGVCAADVRAFAYERLGRPRFPLEPELVDPVLDVMVRSPRRLRMSS
ncbi:MAG TPA: M81 family metallopeptidase [Limnochordia bacterium]|nr:M81 family metallopeptidase [Limnochordia bacterium]